MHLRGERAQKARAVRSGFCIVAVGVALVLGSGEAGAQSKPARQAVAAAPVSDKDLDATQSELIRLLRLSPTLTTVVARDPSLLSNADYVRHNNPQLAQFLDSHPEIALNPDFYLFTKLDGEDGRRDQALERAVWPDLPDGQHEPPLSERLMGDAAPVLVFVCVLGTLIWLIRLFVENRRWGRIFKLQTEVHGKLIDRFSSSSELLTYMDTDAGKRFLEAAPIPVDFEPQQRVPNAVARVLMPLQIGIVLSLLGIGFLFLRHAQAQMEIPMLVLGTLFLMPGIGFILSAGLTWILAARLGLMPSAPPVELPVDARDRQ